jgi:RNA polymerase sigma-70 factor (ECF subfamily)
MFLRITYIDRRFLSRGAFIVNDIDVIKRVQDGDSKSFSILVEKYHRPLLNFIYRLVGDERIVEDIGQEVFLSVYKSIKDFDVRMGTPFTAWLFITARNRCISELRKNRRVNISIEDTIELADQDKSPEQAAIDNERLDAIHASIEQLPEPYKSTILQSLRGISLQEIALSDGISPGTVKSRLFRAREKMKLMLFKYFGGKDYERL